MGQEMLFRWAFVAAFDNIAPYGHVIRTSLPVTSLPHPHNKDNLNPKRGKPPFHIPVLIIQWEGGGVLTTHDGWCSALILILFTATFVIRLRSSMLYLRMHIPS